MNPIHLCGTGKAERKLRGVKRYINIFYRIYNGRRKNGILPMKF
jgi:hypothetical protein